MNVLFVTSHSVSEPVVILLDAVFHALQPVHLSGSSFAAQLAHPRGFSPDQVNMILQGAVEIIWFAMLATA